MQDLASPTLRRAYYQPPVGCLKYLDQWTLQKGAATLEKRTERYGRQPDGPPLSPKSRLVQLVLDEQPISPGTMPEQFPQHTYESFEDILRANSQSGMYFHTPKTIFLAEQKKRKLTSL